jgi:hypothetical protein
MSTGRLRAKIKFKMSDLNVNVHFIFRDFRVASCVKPVRRCIGIHVLASRFEMRSEHFWTGLSNQVHTQIATGLSVRPYNLLEASAFSVADLACAIRNSPVYFN